MNELKEFSIKELCEIYYNLNCSRWDDRLGEKPKKWDKMPTYKTPLFRMFIKTRYEIIIPIMVAIKRIVSQKELSRYHQIHRLGRTEEEFQAWYDKKILNRK